MPTLCLASLNFKEELFAKAAAFRRRKSKDKSSEELAHDSLINELEHNFASLTKRKRQAPPPPANGVEECVEKAPQGGHKEVEECQNESKQTDRLCTDEQKQEAPSPGELSRSRHKALSATLVRHVRLQDWCMPDSDFLSPQQKMDALRSFSHKFSSTDEKRKEPPIPPKKPVAKIEPAQSGKRETGSGPISAVRFWPSTQLGVKTLGTHNHIKKLWHERVEEEENTKRRYETGPRSPRKRFPRFWSNDTLSASLIASKLSPETEENNLGDFREKGLSLESLNMTSPQWYDVGKIRQSISRESIANSGATKSQWEQRVREAPPPQTLYFNNAYDTEPPNLNVIQRDIQIHQQKEAELKLQRQPLNIQRATSYVDFDREKTLFLWYISSHPEVLSGLGISVPSQLSGQMQQLRQKAPKVELREIIEENQSPPSNSSRESTLERSGVRKGRYVKHNPSPAPKWVSRKQTSESPTPRPSPVNRKSPSKDLDDPLYRSRGESLIAREIREAKEREDELRQSRTELGLPTLDDIIDYWRMGRARSMPPLRGAQSLDHLQWAGLPTAESDTATATRIKSGSLDHLHQAHLPVENGLKRDHQQTQNVIKREQENSVKSEAPPSFVSKNDASKTHYERFLQNHHPHKTVIEVPSNNGYGPRIRNMDPVPVEVRIEREVIDLRAREAELKRNRNTTPIQTVADYSAADDYREAGILHREYVGQRNPRFDPAYTVNTSPYGLRNGSNPDVMILTPSSGI